MTGGSFVPFSSLHLLAVVVCALRGLVMAGRALRGRPAEARVLGVTLALVYWFAYVIRWELRMG